MRPLAAALLSVLAALTCSAAARADASFGVADDAGKYAEDGGVGFFGGMKSIGLTDNRITVQWDPDRPMTIVEKGFLDRSLPNAFRRGIHVVFALYPTRGDALTADPNGPAKFAEWVKLLARTYPQVKDYTVGNEPNKSYFWRPQFAPDGTPVAAATFFPVLAAAYDALKAIDRNITVAGVGLSERGNDNPQADSNVSTSPIRFIRDLGAAYRASGRTAPIMDQLVFHPYPENPSDDLFKSYAWPSAGFGNLDRIKQAIWDAFSATGQPTIETGLRLRVGEIGWQTTALAAAAGAYSGKETVAATSEGHQAEVYGELVQRASCDPSISSVFFFGLVDESQLDRWQAALLRANYTAKPAYHIVREWITRTGGKCPTTPLGWKHTTSIVGAKATFGKLGTFPAKQKAWAFKVTADEEATYKASIVRVAAGRTAQGSRARKGGDVVAQSAGLVRAGWSPRIAFPAKTLPAGRYAFSVELAATMNPARKTTLLSGAFTVGATSKK